MNLTGILLAGIAVVLIGISWFIQKSKFTGILFFVMLLGFISSIAHSYWKLITGGLSAVIAIVLFISVMKNKKIEKGS